MSWLKVDDAAFDDPRFTALPRGARLLHLEALGYSMRHDGSGFIPTGSLSRLTDEPQPTAAVAALVAAGLWGETDGGWVVGWLLDDQITPDEIARQRAWNRARQERHRRHVMGDHSTCDPRFCRGAPRNASRNASRNALQQSPEREDGKLRNASITVPRPDPTEGGERTERFAASPASAGGSAASRGSRVYEPWTPERKAKASATVKATLAAKKRAHEEVERRKEEAAERRAAEEAKDQERIALADAERAAENERRVAMGLPPMRMPIMSTPYRKPLR